MGQPEGIVQQLGQVQVHADLGGTAVGHGQVARLGDLLAEYLGAGGDDRGGRGAGAGGVGAYPLPVKDHGVGDVVALDPLQGLAGLLQGLFHGDGLGVEVDAHLQPFLQGTVDIVGKVGVLVDVALGVTPVAHPDHGEVHTGVGHLLPVNESLVGGDVHPHIAGGIALVGEKPVFHHKEAAVIGVEGQNPHLRGLRFGGGFRLGLGLLGQQPAVEGGEHGGALGPGGLALGVEAVFRLAAHDPSLLHPVGGVGRPGRDGCAVGKSGRRPGQRALGVAPQDDGKLLPGHRVVRAEEAVSISGYVAVFGGPDHGLEIPAVLGGVGKWEFPRDRGRLSQAVQHSSQHGPGHGGVGRKGIGGGTRHQPLLHGMFHSLGVPGVLRDVGKCGGGGQGGERYGQGGGQSRAGQCGSPSVPVLHDAPFLYLPLGQSLGESGWEFPGPIGNSLP